MKAGHKISLNESMTQCIHVGPGPHKRNSFALWSDASRAFEPLN